MELERGAVSAPPASGAAMRGSQKHVAIDMGGGGGGGFDDFGGMEIERGGSVSMPPAISQRPSGHGGPASARPHVSGAPASVRSGAPASGSGLEVAYSRASARPRPAPRGPSVLETILANTLDLVLFAGSIAGLVKLVHRHGGRPIASLLPHAFDATSSLQSGTVALSTLAVAIGVGVAGFKVRPRSWAIVGSGVALFLAAIAMVTVTLVATDDNPMPPDGALAIPYVVPFALLLLGIGIARRGVHRFYEGGSRRALIVVFAMLGAVFAFGAIELSALARLF